MGCCASSTETTTNPITGETKTKNTMGGSFPGNRRTVQKPHVPPASQFSNGQAVQHFVTYGGGNALVLQQGGPGGGPAKPQTGAMMATAKPPEYIQVTLPPGVVAGQTIQVAAPDGRLNEIVVPAGMGPGSTFTVEFADPEEAPKPSSSYGAPPSYGASPSYGNTTSSSSYEPVTATATTLPPRRDDNEDDGFASGFGRDDNYSSYPTASNARPVYR